MILKRLRCNAILLKAVCHFCAKNVALAALRNLFDVFVTPNMARGATPKIEHVNVEAS